MKNRKTSGPPNYPSDVIFEYVSDSYIPVAAHQKNGEPYSGKACGSNEVVEWYGSYRQGLADGEFLFTLSDRKRGTYKFVKGVKVE